MAFLRKQGKVYYGVWWEGSGKERKKRWKALSPNKAEADRKLADISELQNARKYGHKSIKASWQWFCDEYLKWSKSQKSPKTHINDINAIKQFNNNLAVQFVTDLTPRHLEQFKQDRSGRVSDSSINRELDTLKSMGRKAQEWGYTIANPFTNVKKKAVPGLLPRFYTPIEMDRIREATFDDYELMMIDIAYYTGMRRGEIANLQWENIDFEQGIIHIKKNTGWITKERKEKVIPLDSRLEVMLKDWRRTHKHNYVLALHDRPPEAEYFSGIMERILRRAELKGSFHWLRHTLGNRLADNNVNLKKIADMMGHASTTTTERYTATQIKTMRDDLKNSL